jgi:hypothetical protein
MKYDRSVKLGNTLYEYMPQHKLRITTVAFYQVSDGLKCAPLDPDSWYNMEPAISSAYYTLKEAL